MSSDEEYSIPEEYFYTKDHEWAKQKPDGSVLVGITDYAAKMLNDVVYVTLPQEGKKFTKNAVFGQVESVKTVSDVFMPLSGTVLKTNQLLTKEPEAVARSPYQEGWMLEIKPEDFNGDVKDLLDAKSYREYVIGLEEDSH
ncbi:MAG TPA: glycine cleavage system protein GcvH [Nitrososphaerales archaeon]|nr:glycine cleavage system protein GcvH [Nitrososphaerales archaeon]